MASRIFTYSVIRAAAFPNIPSIFAAGSEWYDNCCKTEVIHSQAVSFFGGGPVLRELKDYALAVVLGMAAVCGWVGKSDAVPVGFQYEDIAGENFWWNKSSGLDFLDLDVVQTYGHMRSLSQAMQVGGELEGWRHITRSEFDNLYQSFDGDIASQETSAEQFEASRLFFELFGTNPHQAVCFDCGPLFYQQAYWSVVGYHGNQISHFEIALLEQDAGIYHGRLSSTYHNLAPDYLDPSVAVLPFEHASVLVVREHIVSEPATMAIISCGLLGLGVARRRRKEAYKSQTQLSLSK